MLSWPLDNFSSQVGVGVLAALYFFSQWTQSLELLPDRLLSVHCETFKNNISKLLILFLFLPLQRFVDCCEHVAKWFTSISSKRKLFVTFQFLSLCSHHSVSCHNTCIFIGSKTFIHSENIYKGSVQLLTCVRLLATPWTAAHQASLSITNSQNLLRLMSIESVMPSNHLILCHPLLLPPSIFHSIRVFSNESVLCIRWLKYWSFSFNINLSNKYSGLISFQMD